MSASRAVQLLLVAAFGSLVASLPTKGEQAKSRERNVLVWNEAAPAIPEPTPLPIAERFKEAIKSIGNSTNSTNDIHVALEPSGPRADLACYDDATFVDVNGLVCRDYSMNTELCKAADRYANYQRQTARHACCSCGGGDHVHAGRLNITVNDMHSANQSDDIGTPERTPLTEGTDEVIMKNSIGADIMADGMLVTNTHAVDSRDPMADYDYRSTARLLSDVDVEDELNDSAIDFEDDAGVDQRLIAGDSHSQGPEEGRGNGTAMGYPREPFHSDGRSGNMAYTVEGSLDLDLPFIKDGWESRHGGKVIIALATAAGVEPSYVTIRQVRPAVEVDFRVVPENANDSASARRIADSLVAFMNNHSLATLLVESGVPRCDVGFSERPAVVPVFARDGDDQKSNLVAGSPFKQYTTKKYTVGSKETLATIAEKFNVAGSLIMAFNPGLADPTFLRQGIDIRIPSPKLLMVTNTNPVESPISGGVDIVVTGSGFVYPGFCRFGDEIVRASYVVDELMVCPSPAQSSAGVYPLAISDGRGNFREFPFTLRYTTGGMPFCDEYGATAPGCRERLDIQYAAPERWPQDTPTLLYLTGMGFNSSAVCFVAGRGVPTVVHSPVNLTCALEQGLPSGVYDIEVHQGESSAKYTGHFVIYTTLVITSVMPRHVDENGNQLVEIHGSNFDKGCQCRFGIVETPCIAGKTSGNVATCLAPPSRSGANVVQLSVTNDGEHYSPAPYAFEYTHIKLTSLSDDHGSGEGGQNVTVKGYGFYPGIQCAFGKVLVPATYLSVDEATCTTPEELNELGASVVKFRMSDGNKFSDDFLWWTYRTEIHELRPSVGRASGGDDIHIFGHGFDNGDFFTCFFGDVAVHTVVITSRQIQCTSPPGSGKVDFKLRNRVKSYDKDATGESLMFTYQDTPGLAVNYVMPDHCNVFGDKVDDASRRVTVKGKGFTEGCRCVFDDGTVDTRFVDSQTLDCVIPARSVAGLSAVSVINTNDGSRSQAALRAFEYRAVVELVTPVFGPLVGGTTVTVHGRGMRLQTDDQQGQQLCVFGNQVVAATVVNEHEARCVTPPSDGPGLVDFALTTNSTADGTELLAQYLEFEHSAPGSELPGSYFAYTEAENLAVDSAEPEGGSLRGQERIRVRGRGFEPTAKCMFGDFAADTTFVDRQTLECVSPAHAPGLSKLRVALDNGTKSATFAAFSYRAPEISTISPPAGTVMGGTTVVVTGKYFFGAKSCSFGDIEVAALESSDTHVVCKSPPADVMGTKPLSFGFGEYGFVTPTKSLFAYVPANLHFSPNDVAINVENQQVVFEGSGLTNEEAFCEFSFPDGTKVQQPAVMMSNETVACNAPVVQHVVAAQLALIVNGIAAYDPEPFIFSPVIRSIAPAVGPTSGNSAIVVIGSGFSNVTSCAFGPETQGVAKVVSDIMVICTTPPHLAGSVELHLLISDTHHSSPATYTYKPMDAEVLSVHPTSGSEKGGTHVSVRGRGFSVGASCRFTSTSASMTAVVVPAVYHSSEHMECITPPAPMPLVATVEVSQGPGSEDGFSEDGVQFTYHDGIATVTSITPSIGVPGTLITVRGSGFEDPTEGNKPRFCFFGGRQGSVPNIINDHEMTCIAPEMKSRADEVVQVATSAEHLPGGSIVWSYELPRSTVETVAVRAIHPSKGAATGGTQVKVTGVNFPADAKCRFGDLFVVATQVRPTSLECTSPRHPVGTAPLEVVSTSNVNTFSASGVPFVFEQQIDLGKHSNLQVPRIGTPELFGIEPVAQVEGGDVDLHGRHFTDPGFCNFADAAQPAIAVAVAATPDHTGHCICTIPSRLSGMGTTVRVSFISIHGEQTEGKELILLDE